MSLNPPRLLRARDFSLSTPLQVLPNEGWAKRMFLSTLFGYEPDHSEHANPLYFKLSKKHEKIWVSMIVHY
jgi:hypothetical protein